MQLYSTKNPGKLFSLKEAILKGLPDDNGLFMPLDIPKLPLEFFKQLRTRSFQENSYLIARNLISKEAIPDKELNTIIKNSISFPAPLVKLEDNRFILELFHGPSLAFKDFGARFMAQTMSYFNQEENKELTILVATSGDTGGAVAAGFLGTPGIRVVILYPSGKVSGLQEKQLTTLGKNITALEVKGTFDDCQAMVKAAFLDSELNKKHRLSSANSINIARLIPQSFYYFEAVRQLPENHLSIVFSVPSGNFGNLTAGLMAKRMGLPVDQFIAATNVNDVVPKYLISGKYEPRESVSTISNAMDVGAPSNFERIMDLNCSTWNIVKQEIVGYSFSDIQTSNAINFIYENYHYIIDPHGAVGYLALNDYLLENPKNHGIILETAHPSKFPEVVEEKIGKKVPVPERLEILRNRKKESVILNPTFKDFKEWLINH